MAPRGLKIGSIIDRTLGVIEYGAVPALIFIAAVTVISGAITYFTVDMTAPLEALGVGLAKFIVGISAAYLLLDAMVRRTKLLVPTGDDVFVPYFGLSILYSLGVMLGFIVLIIPGLLIMARWVIAQPMLVAQGTGIKEALGESWEETRGAEFQIIVAALALLVAPIVVMIFGGILFDQTGLAGIAVSTLASSAISVVSLAMGVAIYGLIEMRKAAARPAG